MIEAVPNISEGRDAATIDAVAAAITAVPGAFLLHIHSDADHNRSVLTFVSESVDPLRQATLAMFEVAVSRIDLTRHQGEHPRVGAVDVVPFVPSRETEMAECVALAELIGSEVAERFEIPVYLYEHAARHDYRRSLPVIRSGGFENFHKKITEHRWEPDYGPTRVHPSAGVTIIGARVPLIAFNVQLRSDSMTVAMNIARAVRASSGGLPYVRALPIRLARRGIVQVSMNLLDYRRTSIIDTFIAVSRHATEEGAEVMSSEIVGLAPAAALNEEIAARVMIENYSTDLILERRIAAATGKEVQF